MGLKGLSGLGHSPYMDIRLKVNGKHVTMLDKMGRHRVSSRGEWVKMSPFLTSKIKTSTYISGCPLSIKMVKNIYIYAKVCEKNYFSKKPGVKLTHLPFQVECIIYLL